ncbi:MAG: hypothetical protein AAFU85_28430 [Planctomycetota bacterium]
MKSTKFWLLAACIAIASSGLILSAQEGLSPIERSLKNVPGVPPGALLTERGRELAFELKNLYRSKENMGARHPSLPTVEKRIKSVKELLKAFAPAENPFDRETKDKQTGSANTLNEFDLRQLVVQLSKRVEMLEKRVEELERKK